MNKLKILNLKFPINSKQNTDGFTLLELLLVIAIIAVLAGIITFALRPAENIQNATDVQTAAKASDIEKAIQLYALDNNGSLPGNILNKTSISYEEICKEDANSTDNCINLNTLKPDYLSEIPIDETRSTDDFSGYILKYNPEGNSIDVMSASEYESKTDEILSEGLVGYWKMDEASWNGTVGEVVDSSGNGNDGTRAGDTIPASGKFGNGGSFDGVGDYIDMGTNPNFNFTSEDLTLAAWVKTNSTNEHSYIFAKGAATSGGYGLRLSSVGSDKVLVGLFSDSSQRWSEGRVKIDDGIWHHVVATLNRESQEIKTYVDGVEDTYFSSNIPTSMYATTNLTIGRVGSSLNNYYTGQIDEVRIYNRALSDSEVETLFEWAPGPIAHWKFDETSGTTALDSSGNGNDGTLENGPAWVSGKHGNGLSFDGVDDRVVSSNVLGTIGSNPFTVSMWIKVNQLPSYGTYRYLMDNKTGGTNNAGYNIFMTGYNEGKIYFRVANGSNQTGVYSNVAPELNQWNYYVFTRDASGTHIYKNGILDNSNGGGNTYDVSNANQNYVGSLNNGSGVLDGSIDDVRVYNYARTQEQIIEDMNNN